MAKFEFSPFAENYLDTAGKIFLKMEEIKEMKHLAKHGGLTSLCFYPIRDNHYDEGFTSGELVLIDGETGEDLARIRSGLDRSIIKTFMRKENG